VVNLAHHKKLLVVLTANMAVLLLWAWLFRPVYTYLGTLFTRQEFRTNQVVLLAVLVLIAIQVRRGRFQLSISDLPQLHLPGLTLALASSVAFIAAERWLDINTLSATLFGLATYGLLGLWMEPGRWRQGLPAALLLVGVLPFGNTWTPSSVILCAWPLPGWSARDWPPSVSPTWAWTRF
jgi:hypothetical protein